MSVHIHLVDQPEYYTNLDIIHGEVKFFLAKPESIGAVVVKLEGESSTSLTVPAVEDEEGWTYKNETLHDLDPSRNSGGVITRPAAGTVVQENHKILYQVAQVHPLKTEEPPTSNILPAGHHSFPFRFKVPFNNACSDPVALSRTGGMVDVDGNAESPNGGPLRFGVGTNGIRIMDGSKQLQYTHVKQTLPPSFAGYLSSTETTEIRYFVKATVQRPGMFRGNWRNTVGFKFLPIEPIRPPPSTREMFARRPFTFRDRIPPSDVTPLRNPKKKNSFFRNNSSSTLSLPDSQAGSNVSPTSPSTSSLSTSPRTQKFPISIACRDGVTPSIQLIALLPFPAILTCNEPLPLRIVARKLEASREQVYLTSLDIRLIGTTKVKGQDVEQTKTATWMIMTRLGLTIPVCDPDAPVDTEMELPDDIWCNKALPNTVMPSFVACNISRDYQLEVRAGLCWSVLPIDSTMSLASESNSNGKSTSNLSKKEMKEQMKEQKKEQKAAMKAMKVMKPRPAHLLPQTIILPLTFHAVQVYSGIKPNKALVEAVTRHRQKMSMRQQQQRREGRPSLPDTRLHQQFQYQLHQNTYPNVDPSQQPPGPARQLSRATTFPAMSPYAHHMSLPQVVQQGPVPPQMHAQQQPPQHPQQGQQSQQQQQPLLPQEYDQPIFELSSEPAPAVPLRPDGSAYNPPASPSATTPTAAAPGPATTPPIAPPSVPGAVEVSGLPVIRRRPVPQQFVAQQREEQQQRQTREKFPSGEDPALMRQQQLSPIGRLHGSVNWHGPNQHYSMHQQQTQTQTFNNPLYPPQLRPGEDPASMAMSSLSSVTSHSSASGASGGIVAQNGDVLVTYNGVVSSMAPAVASAINAFAFADGDTASIYQEPPPSYDEAMAEITTEDAAFSTADSGGAAMRPAFSGEPNAITMPSSS